MKWMDLAFAAVFLVNLIFVVGSTLALKKILDATLASGKNLQGALVESVDATHSLRRASKRLSGELDRWSQDSAQRDTASDRALTALGQRLTELQAMLQQQQAHAQTPAQPPVVDAQQDQERGITQRLREKLREVLEQNMTLQRELDQATRQLRSAMKSHDGVCDDMQEIRGVHPRTVKDLGLRMEQLKQELSMANDRACAAERLTAESAQRLLDLQAALHANRFSQPASDAVQLETLQQQNQAMSHRERELLAKLDAVQAELQRNLTEKGFIEDRFVDLDTRVSDQSR